MMRRREFITLLGGAAATCPDAARSASFRSSVHGATTCETPSLGGDCENSFRHYGS